MYGDGILRPWVVLLLELCSRGLKLKLFKKYYNTPSFPCYLHALGLILSSRIPSCTRIPCPYPHAHTRIHSPPYLTSIAYILIIPALDLIPCPKQLFDLYHGIPCNVFAHILTNPHPSITGSFLQSPRHLLPFDLRNCPKLPHMHNTESTA